MNNATANRWLVCRRTPFPIPGSYGATHCMIDGEWVKVPGAELLPSLSRHFDKLPLVAEDLGVIADEVIALRNSNHLPGILILQFALDGDPNNLYLPHNHQRNAVVYPGTHDNDTSKGLFNSVDAYQRQNLVDYMGRSNQQDINMPGDLNRMAQ